MQFHPLAASLIGLTWTMPALAETTTLSPVKGVDTALVPNPARLKSYSRTAAMASLTCASTKSVKRCSALTGK
jgi:hypothetical protein